MSIRSLVLRGMPPVGLGAYLRNELVGSPFDFRAVSFSRNDWQEMARRARELGPVWLYSGPSSWTPPNALAELDRIAAAAESMDLQGVIIDCENDWTGSDAHRELAAELGRRASDVAGRTRVGFTSHPSFPQLEAFAGAAGDAVWYSIQIYGRTSSAERDFRRWFDSWAAVVGRSRLTLSIAGWVATDQHRTPAGFREYLASLPSESCAAIAWLAADDTPDDELTPEHIRDELATWHPGGSELGTWGRAGIAFVSRPIGVAVIVAGLLALVLIVMLVSSAAPKGGA